MLALIAWSFLYLNYFQQACLKSLETTIEPFRKQVLPNFPHDIREHCADRSYLIGSRANLVQVLFALLGALWPLR